MIAYLEAAELAPWVEGKGWARQGTAWLTLDGRLKRTVSSGTIASSLTQTKIAVETADQTASIDIKLPSEESSVPFDHAVPVPVNVESVTVVATAGIGIETLGSWTLQGPSPVTVAGEPFEIDLGPSGTSRSGSKDEDPQV